MSFLQKKYFPVTSSQQKYFFLLLIFLINGVSQSQHLLLKQKLDSLTSTPFFDTVSIGINVFDAVEGKTIYAKNDRLLLHPASNMKIITSAAALLYLGPDYQFRTKMLYGGSIKDSVLSGSILFKGGGDPDISVDDLDSFVVKLKQLGIKKITGGLKADVSLFNDEYWGKGWMWDDDPSTDAPFLTPLCVNKNTITVKLHSLPGKELQIDLVPASSIFTVQDLSSRDSTLPTSLNISREYLKRQNAITIDGNVNPRDTINTSESLNVVEPTLFFLDIFKTLCHKYKIEVEGDIAVTRSPINSGLHLVSEKVRSLKEVLWLLNKNSVNLSAELVLRALGTKNKETGIGAKDGLRYVDSLIAFCKLEPRNYRFVDGSGVSHYNLVSAELLGDILKQFFYVKPELYEILRDVFPWSGIDGTLSKRMRYQPLMANVYAKTGTLSGVSCLSGYLHAPSNKVYIFSILMQNHFGKLTRCYEIQHSILKTVAEGE